MFHSTRTIVADGEPISFDRFMEWALYDSKTGYYRRAPGSVPGRSGDYFTASQVQPLFGQLINRLLPDGPVLEIGPGNGEMKEFFKQRGYLGVGPGEPLPESWSGVIFANEFFDALPVVAGVKTSSLLRELLVARNGTGFEWRLGEEVATERKRYVDLYYPDLPDGFHFEIAERSLQMIRTLGKCVRQGSVLIIDYGWIGNEYLRFPNGTLMSYRQHRALENVLACPGGQDITAHVPFGALMDAAKESGFAVRGPEPLVRLLADVLANYPDLQLDGEVREQMKTLLFGLGETFRILWLTKRAAQ